MSDSGKKDKYVRYAEKEPVMPLAPPSKIAESPLFKELRESVAGQTTAFTFACGGTIPIVSALPDPADAASDASSDEPRSTHCLPVDLRWDPTDPSVEARRAKITFPLEPGTESNLDRLIKDMAPATFGRGGEDVYDESYRKAAKLDPTQFSSTFNPYELGIVDAIAQTLLPSLRHSKQTRAVKAELYKLNLYSGPSGKFKAHVDTPRSPAQFGSLVVCLPVPFAGGELQVRHKGRTVAFDWSAANRQGGSEDGSAAPSISWAAFYSDCEHEILEVTEGHRLTLTYNLYSVRGNGQLGGNTPWLDPTHLPLYKTIRDLVQDKEGWENGGRLGFICSHVYPHSNRSKLNFTVPDNLKGADMLLYEIFRALGLAVQFRPVARDVNLIDWNLGRALPTVGLRLKHETWDLTSDEFLEESWDEWAGRREKTRRWWERRDESDDDDDAAKPEYIDFLEVHWLNDWGHEEPQVHWIAYGNEPSNIVTYSCVTMIVEIPPSVEKAPEETALLAAEETTEEATLPSEPTTEEAALPSSEQTAEETALPAAEETTEEATLPSEPTAEETALPSEQTTEEAILPSSEPTAEETALPASEETTEDATPPAPAEAIPENTALPLSVKETPEQKAQE